MGTRRSSPSKRTFLQKQLRLLCLLIIILFALIYLPELPKLVSKIPHMFSASRKTRILPYAKIKDAFSVTISPTHTVSTQEYCLNVPVIMYHHVQPQYLADASGQDDLTVNPEYFDMQMHYLAINGYHAISAQTLTKALIAGTSLPDKPVVVTIDDGYQDIYDYAFPILKKYHIIASLMIPTGLVGKHIGTNIYLTWKELQEMKASGRIFVYSHTVTHAALGIVPSSQVRREISESLQTLTAKLGYTYPLLVYPYGSFSVSSISIEKSLGIVAAFTTTPGTEECRSQIMELPRTRVGNAPLPAYGL